MRRVIRVRFDEGDVAYRLYDVGKHWVKRSPYTTLLLYIFHIMSINFIKALVTYTSTLSTTIIPTLLILLHAVALVLYFIVSFLYFLIWAVRGLDLSLTENSKCLYKYVL